MFYPFLGSKNVLTVLQLAKSGCPRYNIFWYVYFVPLHHFFPRKRIQFRSSIQEKKKGQAPWWFFQFSWRRRRAACSTWHNRWAWLDMLSFSHPWAQESCCRCFNYEISKEESSWGNPRSKRTGFGSKIILGTTAFLHFSFYQQVFFRYPVFTQQENSAEHQKNLTGGALLFETLKSPIWSTETTLKHSSWVVHLKSSLSNSFSQQNCCKPDKIRSWIPWVRANKWQAKLLSAMAAGLLVCLQSRSLSLEMASTNYYLEAMNFATSLPTKKLKRTPDIYVEKNNSKTGFSANLPVVSFEC